MYLFLIIGIVPRGERARRRLRLGIDYLSLLVSRSIVSLPADNFVAAVQSKK